MNNKTARRVRAIALKLSPEGSGIIRHTGTKIRFYVPGPGMPAVDVPIPWETMHRTGTRRTYQRLKRQVVETPRELRNDLLLALESIELRNDLLLALESIK